MTSATFGDRSGIQINGRRADQQNAEQAVLARGSRIVSLPDSFSDGNVEQWLKKFTLFADANGGKTMRVNRRFFRHI